MVQRPRREEAAESDEFFFEDDSILEHCERPMSWQDDLEACFSRLDRLYTAHAMDEGRAFLLLTSARSEGVTWNELSNAVRDFLARDGCTAQQIEMHVADLERRFRPWLSEE